MRRHLTFAPSRLVLAEAHEDEQTFESAGAGAALTYPLQVRIPLLNLLFAVVCVCVCLSVCGTASFVHADRAVLPPGNSVCGVNGVQV